ncbi:MAG: A/G-specific adenine glycosylase [Herminiimonas sp.]|nr:A/G-specific adenine glycosylase [Herminiimonas sp.]
MKRVVSPSAQGPGNANSSKRDPSRLVPDPVPNDALSDPGFSQDVIGWQRLHGRHSLPWQNTRDAYRIWLSEIMLQQTQVAAVIPYYLKFLSRFPTVAMLASAPADEVMAHWSGLGYYSRARNLHRCAQQVVALHGGIFPDDPALLAELPGIGRSTAAAIAAFSYGTRAAILDGNVKRVFARVFGVDTYPGEKKTEEQLWRLAVALLPQAAPSSTSLSASLVDVKSALPASEQVPGESGLQARVQAYTQGLMDLGATLCSRSRPACERCPLAGRCVALATGRVAELPVRKPKKATPQKYAVMLVVTDGDAVLLSQRPDSGIWGGLLSLPELDGFNEPEHDAAETAVVRTEREASIARVLAPFGEVAACERLQPFSHGFTHFKLHVVPYRVRLARRVAGIGQTQSVWVSMDKIGNAPLPAPVKKLLLALFGNDDLFATARASASGAV